MGKYGDAASEFGFEDLDVYRKAKSFRQRAYKLAKLLPDEEKYGLAPQMRKAAVSVTNNIAEGYGRHNWQDNIRFCRISLGSLMELVDDIGVCLDEQYAKPEHLSDLRKDAVQVLRLLNGYINYLAERKVAH
jgi:four helix bundle protein